MKGLKIGCVQPRAFDVPEWKEALERALELADDAVAGGAELVLLPEASSPPTTLEAGRTPQHRGGSPTPGRFFQDTPPGRGFISLRGLFCRTKEPFITGQCSGDRTDGSC